MKKLLILVLIVPLFFLWYQRVPLTSSVLSSISELDVTVTDVSLFPLTLSGVHIQDGKTDVLIGTAIIDAPFIGYFQNPTHLRKLTLKNTTIKSQLDPLDMLEYTSILKLKKKKPSYSPSNGKKVQIDDLQIENLYAEAPNPFGDNIIRLKVPRFSLSEIAEMTLGQLLTKIIEKAK